MQKGLLLAVWAMAVVLASCNQPKENATSNETNTSTKPHLNEGLLDSNIVPMDTAMQWIHNYHQAIKHAGLPEEGLSFMLDANVLRQYLDEHADIAKLDVYLAKNSDSAVTVVYIPAIEVHPDGDSVDYKEVPVMLPGNLMEYAFDRAMPCPVCADRIRIGQSGTADKK